MSNYIASIGTGGHPDGKVLAINPAGDLVPTNLIPLKGGGTGLKAGWRAATQADVDAKAKAEADRRKAEAKKGG